MATELITRNEASGMVEADNLGRGFVTNARPMAMAPAMLAEQQRAKSEIEAALTIAHARPRDEKVAMDRIMLSCQRPGLAAKAQFQYSRGGTDISGASIRLLEAIAQRWGNIDFGWRELSRFPAAGGRAGESVVEAYAWDLEGNLKPRIQFTVEHRMKAGGGSKTLTDSRDIFEYVSNQAMRRVRKCLEQVIPRDVVESACDECDRTLRADIKDLAAAVQKMVVVFAEIGVSREALEARSQRRIEAITPAQVIALRKIYTSIRDGMSEAADWFDLDAGKPAAGDSAAPKPKSAAEEAKEKMRQKQQATGGKPAASKPAATEPPAEPPQREREPGDDDEPFEEAAAEAFVDAPAPDDEAKLALEVLCKDYADEAGQAETLTGLKELRKHADANPMLAANPDALSRVHQTITQAEDRIRSARGSIRSARGSRSNRGI